LLFNDNALRWVDDVGDVLGAAEHGQKAHWGVAVVAAAVPCGFCLQECLARLESLTGAIGGEFDGERAFENVDEAGDRVGHPFCHCAGRDGHDVG
jgi:hypothetical protein